jgi:hypothetical protein
LIKQALLIKPFKTTQPSGEGTPNNLRHKRKENSLMTRKVGGGGNMWKKRRRKKRGEKVG